MHRRHFLAATAAAVSLARPACAAGPSLERRLADFALALRPDELPSELIATTKRILIDTLACAFGAIGSEPATIAEKTIRATFGEGTAASIIGQKTPATIEGAAFVNGVLVRALDLNDTYLGSEPLHPSELVPTALALAEAGGHSGRAFIAALVAGNEASARINDAVSFMERGFHPLCAMAYAAPLIAGRLWNLAADPVAQAVGLSAARGYTSFVVNSGAISMMKAMGFAAAATDGIFATRLAAQGFTGPSDTLEWFAARAKPNATKPEIDLDWSRPRLPKVAFKRFPIQIELAAVAEAGSLIAPKLAGRAIRDISVETTPGIIERVADAAKFRPETRGTADHSLPVCLALALIDGDVTLAQFEHDRWRHADIMALVVKTKVSPSPTLIAKAPKGRGAIVEVVLADGQILRETVEVPEGDAQRPLSQVSLEHKFSTFAVPVLGAERAKRILALIDRLETMDDIRPLALALRQA